jgi:hypothetical protein
MSVRDEPAPLVSSKRNEVHLPYAWIFAECYPRVMDTERALLSIRGMDTSSGDSTEKPKFEKVDSFAFKKFETFIILCVMLAIGAGQATTVAAEQASENRQIWGENRQNRQESGDSGSEDSGDSADSTKSEESVEPLDLPLNLRVPDNMRPTLTRMLRTSPTFRRQIAVLAAKPSVRVSVMYGGMRGDRKYHALSTVRKHEWGAMVVETTIFVPTDLVEIIAHELEHVCEQVEGADLRSLSRTKGVGVYDLNGHFETARAIRAGQNATREYQDGQESLQQTVRAAAY